MINNQIVIPTMVIDIVEYNFKTKYTSIAHTTVAKYKPIKYFLYFTLFRPTTKSIQCNKKGIGISIRSGFIKISITTQLP